MEDSHCESITNMNPVEEELTPEEICADDKCDSLEKRTEQMFTKPPRWEDYGPD